MHTSLPLPPLIDALDAWQRQPSAPAEEAIRVALQRLGDATGARGLRLEVTGEDLAPLDVGAGSLAHAEAVGRASRRHALHLPDRVRRIGTLHLDAAGPDDEQLSHGVELAVGAAWAHQQARRAAQHLEALDAAVREISIHLDLDRVLQVIVDRVRDLADAQYAALGTLSPDGRMDRFITSGIDPELRARIGDLPHGRGLLGLIIREGRSFRIPDIATDPRSYGFPAHHPEMHAFLGVPVTVKGRSVGNLYLTNKRGAAEFSEDDQRLVEMFALHAGIAIENARLHEQVQRLAVVEERERIGRDLHDGIIQRIYGVTLSLDDVEELLESDPLEARRRVDRAIEALHGAIGDMRGFIVGLRPFAIGESRLPEAMEALAAEFRGRSGLAVESAIDHELARALPERIGVELLAIAREALSNVVRHARAGRASLALRADRDRLLLEVADDGIGFDPTRPPGSGHHGLRNMQERSEQLGGTLRIESRPGDGARIIVAGPRASAPEGEQ